MNKALAVFLKNFLLGGVVLGSLAVIIQFAKPEFAGHMAGALPISLTFTIITTYMLFKDRQKTADVASMAVVGGLSWLFYCLVVYLLLKYSNIPFPWVLGIGLTIFIGLTVVIALKLSLKKIEFKDLTVRGTAVVSK